MNTENTNNLNNIHNNNLNNIHNQKIYINSSNFDDVLEKIIKSRSEYLNNDDIIQISNKVKRSHDLLFLSNDMSESLSFHDYKLIIHGILPCGSKTTIIINSIYPSVDVEYNTKLNDDENLDEIKKLLTHEDLKKMLMRYKQIVGKNIYF